MTKHERWSISVSLIGLATQILGFCLVIYSLHQGAAVFQRGVYQNANTWIFDLDKAFIEKPYLRPYFYDGKTIDPGDKTYPDAVAMAEFTLDTLQAFLEHRMGSGAAIHEGWTNYMYDAFDRSPLLRNYIKERKRWYEPGQLYNIYLQWVQDHPNAA